jgi:acyl-CoA thioesterase FadM
MRVDAAAGVTTDALAVYLRLARSADETPDGTASAAEPQVSLFSLRRLDAAPPMVGEVYECRTTAPGPGVPTGLFTVDLAGPRGVAWVAVLRVRVAAPRAAMWQDLCGRADALPAVRLLQRMHKHQCDQAGHVNVQVFFDLVDEAVAVLCQEARVPAPRLHVVQARAVFKAELFAGDVVSVHSGVRGMDAMGLDAVHGIVHQPSGRLACVVETRLARLDASGQAVPSGTDAQSFESGEIGEWGSLPRARAPAAPSVPDSWDADTDGWLQTRALVDMCSTGARQYLATIGLDGARFAHEKITVAAIDYLIEIRKRPRLGCNLTLRSSYLSGSSKVIRFAHHVIDSDRGEVVATIEIVGVMLDLMTHRPMEVPQDVKLRIEAAL